MPAAPTAGPADDDVAEVAAALAPVPADDDDAAALAPDPADDDDAAALAPAPADDDDAG